MKKIIIAIVAALFFVPALSFAQTVSTGQLNALLNEDTSSLLALNGPDAVREHFSTILALLSQRNGLTTPFNTFNNNGFNGAFNVGNSFIDNNRSPFNSFNGGFGGNSSRNNNDDEPDVDTDRAEDIEDDEAELNGSVDMNDFNNGIVFFAYGEDEDEVEDVEDEDELNDIRERGDDLQVRRVDSDLDGRDDFSTVVRNLDEDTDYFFTICVEYEDEDNDETIDCGSVEEFTTDDRRGNSSRNNNDDEPDVETERAQDIEDDEAELNGFVDMNDFNNGLVFFAYGEDETDVEDVEDEDEFDDIDERGDDLQLQRVDSDLDGRRDFSFTVRDLEEDTRYFFTICVEYEDEDDDETLECGDVEEFRTDDRGGNSRSRNDDEAEAETLSADDIEEREARLRGEIELNDADEVEYYFEYGEDEDDLDERTSLREIRRDGIVSERITGLDEDTRYFFRLVIEDTDTGEEDEGQIRNFRTDD